MGKALFRPQFDQLFPEKKQALMEQLAEQYHFGFVRMERFDRWGQSCTTGIFEKDGREFVFVPGDTVTLGWERFAVGLNQDSQEELEYLFQEWDLEQDPAEFIGESMAPVRQAAHRPYAGGPGNWRKSTGSQSNWMTHGCARTGWRISRNSL